jgi:hypothetical protein
MNFTIYNSKLATFLSFLGFTTEIVSVSNQAAKKYRHCWSYRRTYADRLFRGITLADSLIAQYAEHGEDYLATQTDLTNEILAASGFEIRVDREFTESLVLGDYSTFTEKLRSMVDDFEDAFDEDLDSDLASEAYN